SRRTEGRGRKSEVGGRRTEGRGQKSEVILSCLHYFALHDFALTGLFCGTQPKNLAGAAVRFYFVVCCALSSAVEHFLHTEGVAGSNPAARTIFLSLVARLTHNAGEMPCLGALLDSRKRVSSSRQIEPPSLCVRSI